MKELVLGFLTAFVLVFIAMPSLIKVAKLKHLVDEPGEARKLHRRSVPTIGGILIFAGTILGYSLWFPSQNPAQLGMNYDTLSALQEFKFLVASMFILFFLGLKDDIIGVSPSKKLLVHMAVGAILVLMADIRVTDFWGLFGMGTIPNWASIIFSIFVYIVIVNAINLIDGVDGLAAGVGTIAALTFAFWFFNTKDLPLALLASTLAGSLVAFLIYNFNPAKIFMGDSGSLTIGVVVYVLAVKMIEFPIKELPQIVDGVSKPVLAMAILSYPLIDTLRVFIQRTLQGRSPFSADKNHIHHRLLALGLSQKMVAITLYLYTLFVITLTFLMPRHRPNISLIVVFGIALVISQIIFLIPLPKKK